MDITMKLSDSQKAFRDLARDFAREELLPLRAIYERSNIDNTSYGELFKILVPKFQENGLFGLTVPEKYEGSEADTISSLLVMEEIAKVWGSVSLMFAVFNSLTTTPLAVFGNENQKEKYLRPVATGEKIGCYCLTGPEAGSDAGSMRAKAEKTDGGWKLNGSKIFITHASLADFAIIFAIDDQTKKPSAFIVDNFKIGKIEHKAGLWASPTAEVLLDNVFVPEENLLGELGKGMRVALTTLTTGRMYIAAQAIGFAQGAFDWTLNYTKDRVQFGRPLIENQGINFPMAEHLTNIKAARMMAWHAAELKDSGAPVEQVATASSMAKLFATEMAVRAIGDCESFCGGVGYTEESPLPMFRRDADATRIYEGANNIQKIVIARSFM